MGVAVARAITLPVAALFFLSGPVPAAQAQDHVVPLSELRQDLQAAAVQRDSNIRDIERLLARPEAQEELAKAKLDSVKVQRAISFMSDQELARLAARARTADHDVQAGFIKTILAVIGAIVVIAVVIAVVA